MKRNYSSLRSILSVCILMCCIFAASAQVSVDPTDRFYSEAASWEIKGLIPRLPQIRPYPVNVIKTILATVVQSSSKRDADLAADEYQRIFNKPWNVEIDGTIAYKQSKNLTTEETSRTRQLAGEPSVGGDIQFHPLASFGYKLGIYGTNVDESEMLSSYVNSTHDAIQDAATVGPFSAYIDMNTVVAVGTDHLYATAGVSRVGFGPFLNEGLALNDTAYHAANFTFNYNHGRFDYCQLYESIGATDNYGDDVSDYLASNKFLALHQLGFQLTKKIHVAYYETIVFGRRAEPSYLFPAPYMVTQGLNGCNDNLQMGLLLEVKPINTLKWATDFFVDDVEFNDLVKLHLDTKIRVAAQTGLEYAPNDSPCTLMSASYMIITPYTYSHWEYDDENSNQISGTSYNYQNYTNNGICIGASLPPDSDRILFTAKFRPQKSFGITVNTSFARHQNVCEALSDEDAFVYLASAKGQYNTSGGLYTQPMFSGDTGSTTGNQVDSGWDHMLFMKGDHTEYICSLGFSVDCLFPRIRIGQLSLNAGWTLEYIHNAGVDNEIYKGGTITTYTKGTDSNGDATYTYNGVTYSSLSDAADAAQSVIDEAKQNWVNNLYDQANNYFTVSVKLTY